MSEKAEYTMFDENATPAADTLTRGTALAIIANLRYPEIRILETTDVHGFVSSGKDRRTGS